MIEWRDQGALLAVRRHGESAAIIDVLTEAHGLHAGLVRGGASRRIAPILQPGAQLDLTWKARLDEHLGTFVVEPARSRAALLMADRLALAGLNAVCALLTFALPEREPVPALYARTVTLLDLLGRTEAWPLAYLRWELALLEELGFGLDLSCCAATGATEDLAYISPRTGRAVSRSGAGDWAPKLMPLPPVLIGGEADDRAILDGLAVTGHFLKEKLVPALGDRPLPAARDRLVDGLSKAAA